MKKMAIIAYTDYLTWPMGGIINYISNILPYLEKHYKIELWGCSINSRLPEPIVINGHEYKINIIGFARTKGKLLPNSIRSAIDTRVWSKVINQNDYDIVYFHGSMPLLGYKRKNNFTFIVYHQHGLGIPPVCYAGILRYVQRKAMRKADLVFINSDKKSIDKYVNKNFPHKKGQFIQAISQVNMDIFFELSKNERKKLRMSMGWTDEKILIYTGRITKQKDPIFVLNSYRELIKKNQGVKLIYVGTGDLEDKLRELIVELGLEKSVFITGKVTQEEIVKYLQISDIFITASLGEGTSLSIAEALACGLPVVGIDAVGICEFIKDGVNGCLLSERNSVQMAEAIEKVLNIPMYGKNARKSIMNASIPIVCSGIIESIDEGLVKRSEQR